MAVGVIDVIIEIAEIFVWFKSMRDNKYLLLNLISKYLAITVQAIFSEAIRDSDTAPSAELVDILIEWNTLDEVAVLHTSVIKAGKCAIMKASWKPQLKKTKKIIPWVGLEHAFFITQPIVPSNSVFLIVVVALINSRKSNEINIIPEKIRNTYCQVIIVSIYLASGAPITWPALPAVVTTASDIDLFFVTTGPPITARTTQKNLHLRFQI